MAVIAYKEGGAHAWLRCVNCLHGLVKNGNVISPGVLPLAVPQGLVGREGEVWGEIRSTLSVGAYTASVMLCRKLLLHVAVSHGLSEIDDKGKSPNFDTAVKHLIAEGVVTKRMQPWVDRIREVGNEANHELGGITEAQALDVAKFTEQLLRLAYEMDALMAGADGV
jgi:hypothetical protein